MPTPARSRAAHPAGWLFKGTLKKVTVDFKSVKLLGCMLQAVGNDQRNQTKTVRRSYLTLSTAGGFEVPLVTSFFWLENRAFFDLIHTCPD